MLIAMDLEDTPFTISREWLTAMGEKEVILYPWEEVAPQVFVRRWARFPEEGLLDYTLTSDDWELGIEEGIAQKIPYYPERRIEVAAIVYYEPATESWECVTGLNCDSRKTQAIAFKFADHHLGSAVRLSFKEEEMSKVKPISPSTVIATQPDVDPLIERANELLKGPWTSADWAEGRNLGLDALGVSGCHEAFILRDAFQAAGWIVTYHHDLRDGDYLHFQISRPPYKD